MGWIRLCHNVCIKRQFSVTRQLNYKNYYLTKGVQGILCINLRRVRFD